MDIATLERVEERAPDFQCPVLSEASIARLVHDVNTNGFGVIPGFLGKEFLSQARSFVDEKIDQSGGNYVGIQGPAGVTGSGLEVLARSKPFRHLIEQIYQKGTGLMPPDEPYYQLLRCLTGQSAQAHSYFYHYDSYVITVLLPITIPTAGMTGDFLLIANTRKIRKYYFQNIIDKILLDNKLSQKILKFLTLKGWKKVTRLKLTPGNAYFFWGYRTIHANEPCDSSAVRATALFHYVNPHKK